jgi:hypothetical protein
MPYTNTRHERRIDPEAMRARIPGWGVDLDPADRPAVPREWPEPRETGAHWVLPERQADDGTRERSVEHLELPPVFGTAQPLHGLSGRIRRYAYERYGEGRAAHWLLLIAGDRVDAVGAHLRSFASVRPDNPVTETGVLSERRRHGLRSRFGSPRVDGRHQWMDPILVAGPWLLAAAGVAALGTRVRRRGA